MNFIKLFESFSSDLSEGQGVSVDDLCQIYNIRNYTINPDNSIDVNGSVDLKYNNLEKLPIKFRTVTGNFYCHRNKLKSLEGAPESVGGDFDCSDNDLTSLEGSPESVGGCFKCRNNKLRNLKGCSKTINGNLDVALNYITSLEDFPKVGGYLNCISNPFHAIYSIIFKTEKEADTDTFYYKFDYRTLELFNEYDCIRGYKNIVIDRFNDFLDAIGKDPVQSVDGYYNIE
jgi:hypothetical protein